MKISKRQLINIALIYILVLSVFVDLFNGYVQLKQGSETNLHNLYKGMVFLFALPYLFVNSRYTKLLYILIVLAICSVCYWAVGGYLVGAKFDIVSLFKVFYGYFILLFLLSNRQYIKRDQLVNFIVAYGVIAALSMFITDYFGFAHPKYGEDFGFGIQGLFVAGNDLGLCLLMCNCFACYRFIQTSKIYYGIANILLTIAGILIGSVTGLFGSTLIIGCLVFYGFFFKKGREALKRWQKIYLVVVIAISIPILYLTIEFITTIDSYNEKKFSIERLSSGGARDGLRDNAREIVESYNGADLLWGRGFSQTYIDMGRRLGHPYKVIELDQYEIICAYGFVLGGILLLLPILVTMRIFLFFYRSREPFHYWSLIAMLLFLGHAFNAGHAYVNVVAMQMVAAIAFCYIYPERKESTPQIDK